MASNGKTLQSYDIEWQWCRAFWANKVIGENGSWLKESTGLQVLNLFREYVWRGIVPIREGNSVLATFLGENAQTVGHIDTFGDTAYGTQWDPRVVERITPREYAVIKEGRTGLSFETLSPEQVLETIQRSQRVHNALSAIKMTKGVRDSELLTTEINKTMQGLKRRGTVAQRYMTHDPFPYNPQYLDKFIGTQRWWVNEILHGDEFLGRRINRPFAPFDDDPDRAEPWPYYIGITRNPEKALSAIKTEMVQRMSIARHRTQNVNDPNKRVVLKRYLHEVLFDIGASTVEPEEDPYGDSEYVGGIE